MNQVPLTPACALNFPRIPTKVDPAMTRGLQRAELRGQLATAERRLQLQDQYIAETRAQLAH